MPPFFESLRGTLRRFVGSLESAVPTEEIQNCFDSNKIVPLGPYRLKVVELIYYIFRLRKASLYESLIESEALPKISILL